MLNKRIDFLGLTIVLAFIGLSTPVEAAVYYLSSTGRDSSPCSSAQIPTTPKLTFASAWGCLVAGDTLVVQDGTYSQDFGPPAGKSGSASAVITVAAANAGGAILQGFGRFRGNSYINYEGFHLIGKSNSAVVTIESNGKGAPSHDLIFRKVGFQCALTGSTKNDNACLDIGDGAHHNLIEDSWVWGGGRYSVMCYGGPGGNPPNVTCDYNVFRRMVIRMGPNVSSGGNPHAGLSLYYASNNLIENVIVIDSVPASDSSNAAFYITSHQAPPNASGNKFYGVLALNNLGEGWYLDHDGTGSNNEVHDSVFWGSAGGGMSLYSSGTCAGNVINHVIVGNNGSDGIWNGCSSTDVKSSVFYNNKGAGITQSSGRGSLGVENWNVLYKNSSAYSNVSRAGTNDRATDPQLKYIARIESGSPCAGGGESGSNCGADLSLQYKDGVKTGTPLWPWPNEVRIKKEMCTDSYITTGFCGSASLTAHVWTMLGNPVPAEFNGGKSACDVNADGVINRTDIDIAIPQALGLAPCTTADIQKKGLCNIVDVQRIVNASLGLGCVSP